MPSPTQRETSAAIPLTLAALSTSYQASPWVNAANHKKVLFEFTWTNGANSTGLQFAFERGNTMADTSGVEASFADTSAIPATVKAFEGKITDTNGLLSGVPPVVRSFEIEAQKNAVRFLFKSLTSAVGATLTAAAYLVND